MIAFVTVGSTEFDPLVRAVLQESVLESLREKGFDSVVVQCGKSSLGTALEQAGEAQPWRLHRHGMDIDIFRFKPTLEEEFRRADLVISHAGRLSL
jgi:beta-1,4-N-acetylglucosaminyltransferase